MLVLRRFLLIGCVLGLSACMQTRYVVQAGIGQAELWSSSRPVEEVLADPDTDERTRVLLQEAQRIVAFARESGLKDKGNYERYVTLDRSAVVWFMAVAKPLELTPRVWDFPLVGSFPYLGWFDVREARQIRDRLRAKGLDVYVRQVNAYSTGGWFTDPILSTMLSSEDDAFRYLANVLMHELTHANILINDQSTFNESVASFVGDTMARQYISARFGKGSDELVAFEEEMLERDRRGARFVEVYRDLETLYESSKTDAQKLEEKDRILRTLVMELDLSSVPNNASLLGFKTYNTGIEEFASLHKACGSRWDAFFHVIHSITAKDFQKEQQDEIGPMIQSLEARCKGALTAVRHSPPKGSS